MAAADVPALRRTLVDAPEAQDAAPVSELVYSLLLVSFPLLTVVSQDPAFSYVPTQVTEFLQVHSTLTHAFQAHVGAVEESLFSE